MKARSTWLLAALAMAAAIIAAVVFWPTDTRSAAKPGNADDAAHLRPQRPRTPPVPGRDVPGRAPMPELPPNSTEVMVEAYNQAVQAGEPQPGDKAFRATVDAFMKYNQAYAEVQARDEGITVAEVHELTYFGFLVMQTQQWPEIEDLVGRSLTDEERELGDRLVQDTNVEFKAAMRKLVAEGADESKRWELIRATQDRYKKEYFALTGMTPELLDDLLAGDLSRKGAPIATPPPEDMPEGPAYTPPQQRPQAKP